MAQLLLTGTALSSGSSLDQALRWLEVRLDGWASNADAYNALLLQVFGVQGSDATSSLLTSLSGSGLGISLEILDGTTLSGIDGAYTGEAPSGGERIYLKAAWLRSATAAQIEAVLLEELGHAIDTRLKGGVDTCGDEGEIFSALLRGTTPDNAAFSENDQRLININGKDVAIEASDTTAPTGSFGNYATAPAYAAPTTNPFRISTVGNLARPAFADADADGDLDLFIGNYNGNTLFFRNTAAPGATAPVYARANTNPFGISTVGSFASPAFADADGDGDLDLFIGNNSGDTVFFRN
ncbi:MAG: FG-GAP-like repeat-containing protein, partial [Cyanobacteria bacterium]|nr:FG-GAP-like repeat-containing protein [Cyanobacteriota bacterium]